LPSDWTPTIPQRFASACRAHRLEVLRRQAGPSGAAQRAEREHRELQAGIQRRRSALYLLDLADPRSLRRFGRGRAMLRGLRLSPESPLYRQRLAQLAEARLRTV
jgi:hypothetical protein